MKKTHLLVLGAPRSGTTLLTAMLGRHGEVAMLNENYGQAVHDLIGKTVAGNKLCIPNHIEMRRKQPRWIHLLGGHVYHLLYQSGYYRPEAHVSIEDYLRLDTLKIIAIVREGSAVVSSIMRRGEQPVEVALYRWERSLEIVAALKRRHAERLLLLSFEQLVSSPEAAMRAAAAHLGVSYQPQMLEGYGYTPNYDNEKIDAQRAQGNGRVSVNVKARRPGLYRKYERLRERCFDSSKEKSREEKQAESSPRAGALPNE